MRHKQIIVAIISFILFFCFVFIYTYISYQPGALLSCETGEFIKFVNIGTPMKTVLLEGYCSGKVKITSENGETVCDTDDYNSEEDTLVRIRCPDLRHYKNQNLTINFYTYSIEYGNQSGTQVSQYPKNE